MDDQKEKEHPHRPAWLDLSPDQWPPEARTAFGLLADIAERRLRRLNGSADSGRT